MSEKTITYLEMTSRRQLRPARVSPAVALEQASADEPVVRELHDRVAAPHDWASVHWSDEKWQAWAARGKHWIVTVGGAPAGLTSAVSDTERRVELAAFGLAPEFIGHGHGGHALTLAVRAAWSTPGATEVRRVWLRTSTSDHRHALPNYLRRGFTVFRTETLPVLSDPNIFRTREGAID